MSVKSDGEGTGSEFVVRLPLSSAPVDQPAPDGASRSRLAVGAKVAIVEDNPDSRELLCELLSLSGLECRSTGRGDDGLALIREMRPDVALVDVGLPGMDGFEIARHVRSDPSLAGVCMIALTGYGQPSDRARALSAGFDAHVVKPIDPERLMQVLATEPRRARSGGRGSEAPAEAETMAATGRE